MYEQRLRECIAWIRANSKRIPFYGNVLDTRTKYGRDFFTIGFFLQFVLFVYLVAAYNNITSTRLDNLSDSVQRMALPAEYVHVLLLHFGAMVIDRIVYLLRSLTGKLILHLVDVFVNICFMFFTIPAANHIGFYQNGYLVTWFLIKCVCWYYSAKQIRYGYPPLTRSIMFLMKSDNILVFVFYVIYRAIPFAFELKTILDWIFADTTLVFYEFLKFEDLVNLIHITRIDVRFWRESPRARVPVSLKIGNGVTLFILLSIVIWLPLILFTSDTPGRTRNPIQLASMTLSVPGYGAIYESHTNLDEAFLDVDSITTVANNYPIINEAPSDSSVQAVAWTATSARYWDLSPMLKEDLISALNSSTQLKWQMQVQFQRRLPSTARECTYRNQRDMFENERKALQQVLTAVTNDSCVVSSVNKFRVCGNLTVSGIVPLFLRLPAIDTAIDISDPNSQRYHADLSLVLWKQTSSFVWWTVNATQVPCFQEPSNKLGVCVYAISDSVLSLFSDFLLQQGILGLYVVFVWAVGRFFRLYVQNIALRIVYEDIPETNQIWQLILDVYHARQDNDLDLEYALFRELTELFRDPSSVVQLTGRWHTAGLGYAGTTVPIKPKQKKD
eukprot:c4303_g1_i1.p1 GENE.c4303_g1_i1~~c4303_g1_i1.p1  ORF type:complete len:647 (-),score=114.94 c4303_g1_i1:134-1978(-)